MNRRVWPLLLAFSVVLGFSFVLLADDPNAETEDATPVAPDPAGEARPDTDESFDWDEVERRGREQGVQRAARLARAIALEPFDPQWGPAAERGIVQRFSDHAPADFELISATCKATLCMAEIARSSHERNVGHVPWTRVLGFSRGYEHQRDGDRTVVFLARAGHTLPK